MGNVWWKLTFACHEERTIAPKGKRAAQVGVVGAPRGCAHTGFRAGYPKGRRPPVLYHWSRMVRFPAAAVTASSRM